MLHGNGGTENTFFDGYDGQLQRFAESAAISWLCRSATGRWRLRLQQRFATRGRYAQLQLSGKT